jgi:hypothetical protein
MDNSIRLFQNIPPFRVNAPDEFRSIMRVFADLHYAQLQMYSALQSATVIPACPTPLEYFILCRYLYKVLFQPF